MEEDKACMGKRMLCHNEDKALLITSKSIKLAL